MPILHRDLKPANLLVTRHLTVKIADFGLSMQVVRAQVSCVCTCVCLRLCLVSARVCLCLCLCMPVRVWDVWCVRYDVLCWVDLSLRSLLPLRSTCPAAPPPCNDSKAVASEPPRVCAAAALERAARQRPRGRWDRGCQGEPRPTAAIPMENPYCSCKPASWPK